MGKEKELEEDAEKVKDDPSLGVMLSFLHTAKLKANSSLRGDSWMYIELMTLKKRMGKM